VQQQRFEHLAVELAARNQFGGSGLHRAVGRLDPSFMLLFFTVVESNYRQAFSFDLGGRIK
jgi:hypothetical protein